MSRHSGQKSKNWDKEKQNNFQSMKKAVSEWTKESKSMLSWHTQLFTAFRNLGYTTNLLAFVFTLGTWHVIFLVFTRIFGFPGEKNSLLRFM